MLLNYLNKNYIFFYKQHFYFSYLIFLIFLDERYWIFFLFNFFYTIFENMLKFYKKNLNLQTNKFNFFNCFLFYKKIISSSILTNIYYFLLNFINLSIESIYYSIQDLFFFFKFNYNFISFKLFFEFSNFCYFKDELNITNNFQFLFKSKIYFYYIYKKSKLLFFYDFNFLDSYRIDYLFNLKTDLLNFFIDRSSVLVSSISTCLYLNNFNLLINNNFYLNVLSNQKLNIDFFSFFYFYILNLNIISLYLKFFLEIYNFNNEFYFYSIEYKLKDYFKLFSCFTNNIHFYYSVLYLKYNSNTFKVVITNNLYIINLINNYFLYRNLFSFFFFKLIINNFNLWFIYNFYYNQLVLLKNSVISLLFYNKTHKITNKYFLINNQLNYKNIINKLEKKLKLKFNSNINSINLKNLQNTELLLKKKLNSKMQKK